MEIQVCGSKEVHDTYDKVVKAIVDIKVANIKDAETAHKAVEYYSQAREILNNQLIPAMNHDLMRSKNPWWQFWR